MTRRRLADDLERRISLVESRLLRLTFVLLSGAFLMIAALLGVIAALVK